MNVLMECEEMHSLECIIGLCEYGSCEYGLPRGVKWVGLVLPCESMGNDWIIPESFQSLFLCP